MFCIQVVTSGVLEGYVQGSGGPNHYPLYRPLCLLGIDACIYRDMLKWNKSSFLQKLVAAWMSILLTSFIRNVSWVLANITSESSHCFCKGNRNSGCRLCIMVIPFWSWVLWFVYELSSSDPHVPFERRYWYLLYHEVFHDQELNWLAVLE